MKVAKCDLVIQLRKRNRYLFKVFKIMKFSPSHCEFGLTRYLVEVSNKKALIVLLQLLGRGTTICRRQSRGIGLLHIGAGVEPEYLKLSDDSVYVANVTSLRDA